MMNDIYMEYIIKKTRTGKEKGIIALVIVAGVILSAALLGLTFFAAGILMNTQFGSFAFSIGLVLIALVWYGAYLLISMFNLEYEYILTNSEIDIDIIMSKKGRKRLVSFDFKEISICANINDNEHNHDYKNVKIDKTLNLTGDSTRGNVYFVDFSNEGERTRVLFQPTQKMINEVKKFNPRNIFVMEE